ncbi:MAG TPA: nicotinamide-nucleotide amidohydrolase family protein [Streptosporangiaceae bacterium]|nr:nicotinamide-nucleotide amidohydrolase family protein [Streptosporangiaceae bacterium]
MTKEGSAIGEDAAASGGTRGPAGPEGLARQVIASLRASGQTVATAESLTGGLVAAALTSVPGASAVVRGGIVAYTSDLKAALLGVPASMLGEHGAVHPGVAEAMAAGVRERLGAAYGVATTGVAGPDPADGQPVGTVYIAVSGRGGTVVRGATFGGDRGRIRRLTVECSLSLLLGRLREETR